MTGKEIESAEVEVQVVRPPVPVPRDLQRVDSLAEVATHPDGTVLVWHQWDGDEYERQAGVLVTSSSGERDVRPISVGFGSLTALAFQESRAQPRSGDQRGPAIEQIPE